MPGEGLRWTSGMRSAWQWLFGYQAEGYHAAGALEEYRETGGAIRTQDWYTAWRTAQETSDIGGWLQRFPEELGIPRDYYTDSGFDWRQEYVAQIKLRLRDEETGEWIDEWKTLEYDDTITMDQIKEDIEEMLTVASPGMDPQQFDIMDMRMYHRVRQ